MFNIDDYITTGPGPGAGATPAAAVETPKLPWYKRPIALKGLLGLGAGPVGMAANVAGGAMAVGSGIKAYEDRVMDPNAAPLLPEWAGGSRPVLTPEFQKTTADAGGYGAYAKSAAERTAGLQPAVVDVPSSGRIGGDNVTYSAQATTAMDQARGAVPAVPPKPEQQLQPGFAGVIQGIMGLKQIQGDNAAKRLAEKQRVEGIKVGAQAGKDTAEATLALQRAQAAERARSSGASDAEIAAITSGRSQGGAVYQGTPTMDGKSIDVLQTRGPGAGAVVRRTPQPPITRAEVTAMAKSKGLTEAQVLENMKQNGRVLAN